MPEFFNILAGVFKILNPILEVFMDLGAWLWDSFLQPIASWTGGVIVDVLGGIADVLQVIGDWMKEHKGVIEAIAIVVGSFALAWGLVNVAFGIYYGILNAYNAIVYIASTGTSIFAGAMTALNLPLLGIVAAVAAVIAIGVLLVKHWDEVKEKCGQVWDWIKDKFNQFKEWLGGVFATDWSEKFGFLGDILNAYLTNVKNVLDGVKRFFSGIIDFIAGVFTGNWDRAWKGVKNIFKGIWDSFTGIAKAPINMIIGLINGMISAINVAIRGINKLSWEVPSWVPIIGGETWGFDIPQLGKVPYLAKGGIVDSATLAVIGEAGKEAVMPLENNTGWITELAYKLAVLSPQQGNSFVDRPIEIILKIGDTTLGKFAADGINKLSRQKGRCVINV